ncbi:MAG: aldehyde dehydrogenase family protein [Bdellovibrionaceae bacterium]|nr:aldehyde dehydrogenase family protein [Pseudobdellovibrionaceae bacterium]NUM59313.1 aldehyde dehydrogenase family protein [Pseudobdellovibrionaceae bacterium]
MSKIPGFTTQNPSTEEFLSEYFYDSPKALENKIEQLSKEFSVWRLQSIEQRLEVLSLVLNRLKKEENELAKMISLEMGKPLAESIAEVKKCYSIFEYYERVAPILLAEKKIKTSYDKSLVSFEPLGVVLSIMPWNYPLWQVLRFAVPAWLSGNVILLKPAEITSETSLIFERLVREATGRSLVLNVQLSTTTIEELYSLPDIKAVTFTGSTEVGRRVGMLAGKNLKKSVLELGGNDAYILDESADIEKSVDFCLSAKLVNNGQSCIAAKRFFVPEAQKENFLDLFVRGLLIKKIGDPFASGVELGPLAHKRFHSRAALQAKKLELLLDKDSSQKELWEKLKQRVLPEKGFYYPPQCFVVNSGQGWSEEDFYKSFQREEIFAPIALVYVYNSEEELYHRVNQSPYGLGAAWFGDPEKFQKTQVAKKIDVGMLSVNEMLRSDARVPFGGIKDSGYGRELGEQGLFEFCSVRTLHWGKY